MWTLWIVGISWALSVLVPAGLLIVETAKRLMRPPPSFVPAVVPKDRRARLVDGQLKVK